MSGKTSRFDWAEIHRRLESDMANLGTSIGADSERAERLLRARTAQLAAIAKNGARRTERLRAIVLKVAKERYALSLNSAHEVVELRKFAIVPGAGAAALGVINWHGELVMAYDLASLVGIGTRGEAAGRKVVVMRGEEPKLALVVDGVDHVAEIDVSSLQQVDPVLSNQADIFRGITKDALVLIDDIKLTTRLREEARAA